MFQLSVPLTEILVRGTVMFLGLYVLLRIVGRRETGAHSLTDLLVVVLIAEAASHGMAGEARGIVDSLVLAMTIIFWSVALDALAYAFPRLRVLLKSRPAPLIIDGSINRRALRREFMDRDELMAELRLHGITDVGSVARAYLEPNGMVSIIRKDGNEENGVQRPPVVG
jgi:uncharacterized membrane protein YcaP (DUF421 family)